MSEKRSLFEVIENGKEIEKDKNLTAMEKMSEGVDKLIEMTQDAFDHIRSLEDALEMTDSMAAKTKRGLESHIHEENASYEAIAKRVKEMSDHLSTMQEYMILLLNWAGHGDMAQFLKEQREKLMKEGKEYPF